MSNKNIKSWQLISDIYNIVRNNLRAHLQQYNLSPAQYDVIFHLKNTPGLSQKELGDKLFVSKGNVTGLINRLEKRNIVERKTNPKDGRSYILFLTKEGQSLADEILPSAEKLISNIFNINLDASESSFHDKLNQVLTRLDKMD